MLELEFVHIDEWYFLVPKSNLAGSGAAQYKKNWSGKWYLGTAFVPAELKKYFEDRGIIYHQHSQGKYPAGFAAPATAKNEELMKNYAEILRQISLAQAYAEAKLFWHKEFYGVRSGLFCAKCGADWQNRPKCTAVINSKGDLCGSKETRTVVKGHTGFLDRIKYLEPDDAVNEIQKVLSFCESLCHMLAPHIKLDSRSWIEEAILKRKKREVQFKRFVPAKCTTPNCSGRLELLERLGKVFTFQCSICKSRIKRKFVKRKQAEKSIGKTHIHNWIASACGCHKYMCGDPICSAKSNHKF